MQEIYIQSGSSNSGFGYYVDAGEGRVTCHPGRPSKLLSHNSDMQRLQREIFLQYSLVRRLIIWPRSGIQDVDCSRRQKRNCRIGTDYLQRTLYSNSLSATILRSIDFSEHSTPAIAMGRFFKTAAFSVMLAMAGLANATPVAQEAGTVAQCSLSSFGTCPEGYVCQVWQFPLGPTIGYRCVPVSE
jgi:hypothetical protein